MRIVSALAAPQVDIEMDLKTLAVMVVIVIAGLVLFMGRYVIVAVPAGGEGVHGIVYRLDRWTGDVYFVQGAKGGRVELEKR